jgi:hypothetical protein
MLDLLTAAPVEVRFGDKVYKLGALKLREWGILQKFIRERSPRPTEAIKPLVELTDDPKEKRELQKAAHFEERDHWPPPVGSLAGNRLLLNEEDGQKLLVRVMLEKYNRSITDAEVEAFFGDLSNEGFGIVVALAFGEDGMDPQQARKEWRQRMGLDREDEEPPTDGAESTGAGSTSLASSGS